MINHISTQPIQALVAVESTPHAIDIVDFLAHITWPVGTSIQLLAMVPEDLPQMEPDPQRLLKLDEPLEIARWRSWAATRILTQQAIKKIRRSHIHFESEICRSQSAEEIIGRAVADRMDLVVVGTGGAPPNSDRQLSPKILQIAHYAPCSVLIIRPTEPVRPLNIILAVDDTSQAQRAVRFLSQLSLPDWARVVVVNVVESDEAETAVSQSSTQADQSVYLRQEQCFGQVIEQLHAYGVQVHTLSRRGYPVKEILAVAREKQADLIVVGGYQAQDKAGTLGHVADRVAIEANCSILIAR